MKNLVKMPLLMVLSLSLALNGMQPARTALRKTLSKQFFNAKNHAWISSVPVLSRSFGNNNEQRNAKFLGYATGVAALGAAGLMSKPSHCDDGQSGSGGSLITAGLIVGAGVLGILSEMYWDYAEKQEIARTLSSIEEGSMPKDEAVSWLKDNFWHLIQEKNTQKFIFNIVAQDSYYVQKLNPLFEALFLSLIQNPK